MHPETVEIVGQGGQPLVINKDDFDPAKHVLFSEKDKQQKTLTLNEKPKHNGANR